VPANETVCCQLDLFFVIFPYGLVWFVCVCVRERERVCLCDCAERARALYARIRGGLSAVCHGGRHRSCPSSQLVENEMVSLTKEAILLRDLA